MHRSKTDIMQLVIGNSISEHFCLVFGDDTVIHMRAGSQIVVDTCGDGLNANVNRFVSGHIILVFRLEDSHGVE